MNDRPISTTTVLASTLWVVGFGLAFLYAAIGLRGTGVLAMLIAAGGATLTVRGYLCRLEEELFERERNAFQLGRDDARSTVRPFR